MASGRVGHRSAGGGRGSRGRRALVTGLGVVMAWAALGALGYVGGWQVHASRAGSRLLAVERSAAVRTAGHRHRACVVSAAGPGQLAGALHVPALHLTAPVEEGTSDAELSVAVGHAASSVWPGQSGTSVLLAHDVSYFVHLGGLRPGDRIVYRTACRTTTFVVGHLQVVPQGTAIPGRVTPTLVLDTCYPTNALFFTTSRLLVWATERSSVPRESARPAAGFSPPDRGTARVDQVADPASYSVPVPAALGAQGLTLEQNEVPMGTMTITGAPSRGWEQSPGPLYLEAAALEGYFGGLRAARQDQGAWWAAISSPGLAMPAPLLGGSVTGHGSPLDVEIDAPAGPPTRVVLRTTVTVSGGPAPGTYHETVTEVVGGSTVKLGGWVLVPA